MLAVLQWVLDPVEGPWRYLALTIWLGMICSAVAARRGK